MRWVVAFRMLNYDKTAKVCDLPTGRQAQEKLNSVLMPATKKPHFINRYILLPA